MRPLWGTVAMPQMVLPMCFKACHVLLLCERMRVCNRVAFLLMSGNSETGRQHALRLVGAFLPVGWGGKVGNRMYTNEQP